TLLTGATGFLGRHLLRELLRADRRPIICLVRADDDEHARARIAHVLAETAVPGRDDDHDGGDPPALLASGRIRALAARLERPGLGLTDDVLATIAGEVDTVLHA